VASKAGTCQPQPGRSGVATPLRSGPATDEDDYDWFGLAAALASFSGLAELLLTQHAPNRTGHCTTCRRQADGVAEAHPCKLRAIAELAIKIKAGR
jgi:hypothetical protein